MAKLEVEIGADKKDFDLKVKEVEKDIQDLSKIKLERIKLGLDTKDINLNIKDAKKSLNDLKTSLKDTGQSFNAMQKPVSNGGNTLMQFSRIAQDAPFGIMGIGNNITATVEAFGHLKNSTGSAGGALKAVAGSIMGSGGILLAVSLVTSALTYMSQNNLTVGDVLDKVTGNFDNLKKAMIEVANEAKKSAGAEIANMNALVAVSKDENNTRQDRLNAVKKLQEEYPAYFGNLTKEQILNGDVAAAVRMTTVALIEKAKAGIIANKIAENDLKLLQEQQKGQKEIEDFTNRKGIYALLNTEQATRLMNYTTGGAVKTIDNLKKEQALLTKELEKSTKATVNFDAATEKVKENAKVKKEVKAPKFKGTKQSFGGGFIGGGIVNSNLNSGFAQSSALLNANIVPDVLPEITQKTKDIEAALLQFNENTNAIIGDSIASTFMNLGQVIGEALANGGNILQAAGNSLLSAVGGLLSAMGGELIKLGTAAILAGTVTKTFGSIVGIGAGIAAIAGGTLLSAAGAAISSKANKSVSGYDGQGGGVSTGANYSSPNTSGFGSSGSNSGTVVFEISGQSLIGVLSNTLDRNSRLGGALSIG